MHKSLLPSVVLSLLFVLFFNFNSQANNAQYEQRQQAYMDSALAHFDRDALPIQAYRGLPLDTTELNGLLYEIEHNGDADFKAVQAVRILYFTNGSYDSLILHSLNTLKYWINKADSSHVYWSENHMIMWMSCDWLLHEKYGKAIDATLHDRLVHFLQVKIQYGYYEFFSSTYNPYCLSGLLNLADFSQDATIKSLATQAAQKLLAEYQLRLTTDMGVYYPIAGRNYFGKYENAYGQNHNSLIYLLTGLGEVPDNASHSGGFLSTSTLPVDSVIASWTPNLDTTYYIGHTLDSGFVINANLDTLDRTIMQWSAGEYFHPDMVDWTGKLLNDSMLWVNYTFQQFSVLQSIPASSYHSLAESLSSISKSSVICGEQVYLFKHQSVALASVQDFWKGKVGFQQFPMMATVGTTAVYTASGEVKQDWTERSENENDNLPYIQQKKNVALLMYRPEPKSPLFGVSNADVAIHWKDADFDEQTTDSMWIIGRQQNSYVAVRRYAIDTIDHVLACHYTTDGQAYVIIVGDSAMYGSYNNFKSVVHQAQFSDDRYYDSINHKSVYYASIHIDTINIDYAWANDSSAPNGINDIAAEKTAFNVYPNPATNQVQLDLSNLGNQPLALRVVNMMGETIYTQPEQQINNRITLNTSNWAQGMYFIVAEGNQQRYVQRLVKK